MPLNKHVMTNAFRLGLIKVYRDALISAKIAADTAKITPHIYGAATVSLTDKQLATLREKRGADLTELSGHGNSGAITILLPEGEKFLLNNRPTLTDEERAAKRSKGTGARAVSAEEAAKRKEARERMERLLAERYGIDLSENRTGGLAGGSVDTDEE